MLVDEDKTIRATSKRKYTLTTSTLSSGTISGITYGAESSTTNLLGSWTAVPDSGTPPQHIFSVPMGSKRNLYMRLKVSSP